MFHFKQFSVDQSGCAMKINTDGVLLGALTEADDPKNILDIGTGTGVIALMAAQRFHNARIDAVEIDATAAQTAKRNFENSLFADRLAVFPQSFEEYFLSKPDLRYDLIISNPPFYINSLESPDAGKQLAKHAERDFFEKLLKDVSINLSKSGYCWLVLPLTTATMVRVIASNYNLYVQKVINLRSYPNSAPHREIICFGFNWISEEISNLTIYKELNKYSERYQLVLQHFFLAF